MKKIRLFALLMVLCMLFMAFTSCDITSLLDTSSSEQETPKDGVDGKDGQDGLSAYDIAVKNGFEGTEQEWLDSLKADTEIIEKETVVNQNITENKITIEGESNDLTVASNKGLCSIVSVYATFEDSTGEPYTSAGSGVILSVNYAGDAFILTNYHVVYDSESATENKISDNISLYLYGREYIDYKIEATYVGGSMSYDLAVLRVEDSTVMGEGKAKGTACSATIAKSEVVAGETVLAIGNPSAEGISVTSGVVSVDSEYIQMLGADNQTEVEFRVIRTDTPINQGNSGGGLFNSKGELVGIVNAKIISSEVENIGYAIPAGVFSAIYDNIIYYCYKQECESVMRPMLGISLQVCDMWTELNEITGRLKKYETSEVVLVEEGSLAEGKLEIGDIITQIKVGDGDTITVTRQYQIIEAIINARVGEAVQLTVCHNSGSTETVSITITEECLTAFN